MDFVCLVELLAEQLPGGRSGLDLRLRVEDVLGSVAARQIQNPVQLSLFCCVCVISFQDLGEFELGYEELEALSPTGPGCWVSVEVGDSGLGSGFITC